MARLATLVVLALLVKSSLLAQPRVLVGRVVNVSNSAARIPVPHATVTLLNTNQDEVTDTNGRFQFSLPPVLIPGSEVQIVVKAGDLRLFIPPDGVLIIPGNPLRPIEVQLVRAGSLELLKGRVEQLVSHASKPPTNAELKDPSRPRETDHQLRRYLKQWANDYGFSLEQVEDEVKAWSDQVRANRTKATVRQRALAEFADKNFAEAANLFEASASAEAADLERIERERKAREDEERTVLRLFLDDKIRESEALTQDYKYDECIQVLKAVTVRVDRSRYAEWWAEMQVRLGVALQNAGEYGESQLSAAWLHAALSAYQSALQVYAKESLPRDWATTQNDLGMAYTSLGERQGGTAAMTSLVSAENAFASALQVLTRASLRQDWATTQNNLGRAYQSLGVRQSGTAAMNSLAAAVAAYTNALQVFTRASLPQDWATTQNNLGNAYASLGERQSGTDAMKSLVAAVGAYSNALQVRTKESQPQAWGITQSNLGNAYQSLGERQSGADALKTLARAVDAYTNALRVTKESLPQVWASTQNNLGSAYQKLGERQSGSDATKSLANAIAAHANAIQVFTRESLPQDWARTQNDLGTAYLLLGERQSWTDAMNSLAAAVDAYTNALQVFTKESLPQDWAATQNNLGTAYRNLAVRQRGTNAMTDLARAVGAYTNALQVRTKESLPQDWAATQNNLGTAYADIGQRQRGTEAMKSLEASIRAITDALQVFTREALPRDWAATQKNLGIAYVSLWKRQTGTEATKTLAAAVGAYTNTLQFITKESQPQDWAAIEFTLARLLMAQERWEAAAEDFENVLASFPGSIAVLQRLEWVYHERLFRYKRAFDLNAARVATGNGGFGAEVDFVEKHLTTGRFTACASRAIALQDKSSQKDYLVMLELLRFACVYADRKTEEARDAGLRLRNDMARVDKVTREIAGTKHFLIQSPVFAHNARDWVRLFEGIVDGDRIKREAALAALGVPE